MSVYRHNQTKTNNTATAILQWYANTPLYNNKLQLTVQIHCISCILNLKLVNFIIFKCSNFYNSDIENVSQIMLHNFCTKFIDNFNHM